MKRLLTLSRCTNCSLLFLSNNEKKKFLAIVCRHWKSGEAHAGILLSLTPAPTQSPADGHVKAIVIATDIPLTSPSNAECQAKQCQTLSSQRARGTAFPHFAILRRAEKLVETAGTAKSGSHAEKSKCGTWTSLAVRVVLQLRIRRPLINRVTGVRIPDLMNRNGWTIGVHANMDERTTVYHPLRITMI